jgi:predicted protein tyrosine phosphatase
VSMTLTAVNIPSEEAERIIVLPSTTALISIGNEYEPFWNLKVAGGDVLKVVFSDTLVPVRKGDRIYSPISPSQALQIVDFISKRCEKKFVVNCHAGISRSAAVCLFINKTFGHELKPNFWDLSHPNKAVYELLLRSYQSPAPHPL